MMDANSNKVLCNRNEQHEEDEEVVVQLPGFRFYPTDQELVGFYLRRKVENKPFSVELINQIDVYKFDPWDLPKPSAAGDSEGYFFCQRGRKYKNSIRPNRVTGSGFWKATGIDKPIYSVEKEAGSGRSVIGLKKSLVFYRGCAGKGTKTDWMMHEFRLPPNVSSVNTPKMSQEAEVWTLCRIFRRNVSSRKYTENWREISTKKNPCNMATMKPEADQEEYISFEIPNTTTVISKNYQRPIVSSHEMNNNEMKPYPYVVADDQRRRLMSNNVGGNPSVANSTTTSDSSYCPELLNGGWFTDENWDELRSFVEFALSESPSPRSVSI